MQLVFNDWLHVFLIAIIEREFPLEAWKITNKSEVPVESRGL
jgi:hypothetical protein